MRTILERKNFPVLLFGGVLLAGFFFFLVRADRQKKAGVRNPAARAELVRSSRDQRLQKFNLTGFDDKGESFWKLEGDTAKIDPGQTVYLDQNVTLRLKDNTVVRTDHVQWSQGGGVLTTPAAVYVEHERVKVKGVGALGKPNQGFLQLNRRIEMIIDETTTLVCRGPMKIFYNENKMIFYRNVKVTDARGTLSARRMDVRFDPNERKIKEIVATGDVVIERGLDTTRSERAIYTVANGAVRLEGSPEVTLHKTGAGILDGAFRN